MPPVSSCALCRRERKDLIAVLQRDFCVACLSAVGRFLCSGPAAAVESTWRARPQDLARRALMDLVDDEIAKIRKVRGEDPSVEPLITEFKAGFVPDVRPPEPAGDVAEPLTHLDLAIAYRAMGLSDDALGEAAVALTRADQLGARAGEAAEIVLAPGNLRRGLDESLVELRRALFPD